MKKRLQIFLDQLNDLIEIHGEQSPITLGQMRDIIQENILRKELKEVQDCFFVDQKSINCARVNLASETFNKWFDEHYPVTIMIRDPAIIIAPNVTGADDFIKSNDVNGAFSGIY